MNSSDFEIFYNWNNSLKTNDKIQYRSILAKVRPMISKKVYSMSELEELLLVDGYKQNLIKEALKEAYSSPDGEESEDDVEDKVDEANGVPSKYSDISGKIEKVLQSQGAGKFVKLMTQGQSPLVKLSHKELETFQRLADLAFENPVHLETLHVFIKPSIVSELAENVCRARKIRNKCKVAKTSNGTYKITHSGKTIEASAKPLSSTSEKFATSNYAFFGVPDEYIIIAHEEASPYKKIKEDLARGL